MNDPAINNPAINGPAENDPAANDLGMNGTAKNDPAAEPVSPASSRAASLALFRAHATAQLRGDTAEAARIAAAIGDERRMIHLMFTIALFTEIVLSELGDRPDPCDLAELTRTLHHKHHPRNPRFKAIRAEALIRAVCGESLLFTEIAYAEQPAYLWTVMTELVPPDSSDEALAKRFRFAEESGSAWREAALEEPFFAPPEQDTATEAVPEPESGPKPEAEPEPEPEAASEPEAVHANRQEPQS